MTRVSVDTDRFLADLHELRGIGTYKTGVSRPTYGPEDMESRRWLMEQMREAGLEPEMDGIGNVLGRTPAEGPRMLVGSHIESQLNAGWLDGALGVVAGLALARAGLPVDVVAFADEEGHYGTYLGSRSMVGDVTEAEIDSCRNGVTGASLRDALTAAGLDGRPRMRLDPARYRGFVEMHIEQGPDLELSGLQVGAVTGIVGIWHGRITVHGRQAHAGTTPMAARADAGKAAVRILSAIDAQFPEVAGPDTVWTCCNIELTPGAPAAVIPGKAEIYLEARDLSDDLLLKLEQRFSDIAVDVGRAAGCDAEIERFSHIEAVPCAEDLVASLSAAAGSVAPGRWKQMPSRAGHDAKVIAREMPVAMLFVPSINGVSHHWEEDTKEEDLALGLRVLAEGVADALAKGGS